MLGDISGIASIFIVCGYTDMRKSIDGLAAMVKQTLNKASGSGSETFDKKAFIADIIEFTKDNF
ncbi:IS66 family insertion sequence element accessory protein TnpB [[Clostridium] fimetarium]|uniref:IS66 Orf2 like protein n=1 Tax=[Clostridium] fimetarium TaxID=99656 RepID=A0A1I0RTZ5_9FIRM|nr:IS66 family insertion sequence element accessory protein TnpB [[Clostridium] fimetarium]SEW44886.1 IS66 Orf2 like protein [[Clostridium] fimetarium]